MLNPGITETLAECDELYARVDPGNWMRMYGPIPAIRIREHYPAIRQHIADQDARIAELENHIELMRLALAKREPEAMTFTTGGHYAGK